MKATHPDTGQLAGVWYENEGFTVTLYKVEDGEAYVITAPNGITITLPPGLWPVSLSQLIATLSGELRQ